MLRGILENAIESRREMVESRRAGAPGGAATRRFRSGGKRSRIPCRCSSSPRSASSGPNTQEVSEEMETSRKAHALLERDQARKQKLAARDAEFAKRQKMRFEEHTRLLSARILGQQKRLEEGACPQVRCSRWPSSGSIRRRSRRGSGSARWPLSSIEDLIMSVKELRQTRAARDDECACQARKDCPGS